MNTHRNNDDIVAKVAWGAAFIGVMVGASNYVLRNHEDGAILLLGSAIVSGATGFIVYAQLMNWR